MKVAPEKPHFFKPILPGFKNGLKIPIGFLKYLKGHEKEHAVLRRAGKKWKVKVNGRNLEEGWEKFAEEFDLQVGNILVFRHEGNMEFEVVILDLSHCDKEYGWSQQGVDERGEEKPCFVEESSKKFDPKANVTEKPESKSKKRASKAFPNNVEDAYKEMHLNGPHFICTIRPYYLSRHFLFIPDQFARENRLTNRKCKVLVRDERRSWTFSMSSGTRTCFGRGWHEFCIANCLKEGDRLIFELVSNGETPVFRFYDLRGRQSIQPRVKKNNSDGKRISDKVLHFQGQTDLKKIKTSDTASPKSQVAASTSADTDANPYFISSIKPYTISKSILYLPLAFVRSNGLMDRHCEMILIDEKRRSWSVQIGPMTSHFVIKSGLPEFIRANNVQVGDTYKFELASNGSKPIAYFHYVGKYCGKDAKNTTEAS